MIWPEHSKNDPFERGCRFFQLFFNDIDIHEVKEFVIKFVIFIHVCSYILIPYLKYYQYSLRTDI
jgi:hypothetical protein